MGWYVCVYSAPPAPSLSFRCTKSLISVTATMLCCGHACGEDSVGFVKDCHWLQHYENIVDPGHLFMLPQMISGDQLEGG